MELIKGAPHRRYDPLRDAWVLVSPGRTNRPWSIPQGTLLTFSANTTNEETAVVQAGGTVNLTNVHPIGAAVLCRGNPGPWTRYDPRFDSDVVPYFAVID